MTEASIVKSKRVRSRIPRRTGGGASMRRRLYPLGVPWILPALAMTVGVIYFGIGYTGAASTLSWNGLTPNPPSVGGANYLRILGDPVFWQALEHTVIFFVVVFVAQTALGLIFAVLLHSKVRLAVFYKIIIFVPVVLAPAIMAPVFRQIWGVEGQINWVLGHVGLGFLEQPWLAQSSTSLGVIMSIQIWEFTGLTFVLYYAAMGQIDPAVLEAAHIDGAGNIRTLISIIWPEVRGTTVALAMLTAIGSLKTFDIPYLVTAGGPNYSTEFLGTYIFRISIPAGHVGYGAAISIVLLVVALTMAILLQATGREKKGRIR
ncbi:MAG: sugar transporter permease [Glaciihabitans sp.]|nr:sugar transporter permease [Glaciihabitans sp.]MCU1535642.1 sugar transporter permease [Glaciihabitans sp.]